MIDRMRADRYDNSGNECETNAYRRDAGEILSRSEQ